LAIKDSHFMKAKDLILLILALAGFYLGFLKDIRAGAKEAVTRSEVNRMIQEDSPWIRERSGVLTELKIMNQTLQEIKVDIRMKVDKK